MMKNDKRTIGNLLEREEPLENPLMIGMIQLTLLGNRSALIENYKGLIEYHDKLIIVQSKEEEVSILGDHLRICYYTRTEMQIAGNIEKKGAIENFKPDSSPITVFRFMKVMVESYKVLNDNDTFCIDDYGTRLPDSSILDV